jgi:hypothetical protein
MAEQLYGLNAPLTVPLGIGWLDYQNLLAQIAAQASAASGTTGANVLETLGRFLTSPTAGPLGLAAAAAYGGPQGIAAGTGGKGFDTSGYTSRFDALLDSLIKFGQQASRSTSDVPVVDPFKQPAPSPENAAKAPNLAQEWVKAWEAYHPGQKHPLHDVVGLAGGGRIVMEEKPTGLAALAKGAEEWVKKGGNPEDYWARIRAIWQAAQPIAYQLQRGIPSDPWMGWAVWRGAREPLSVFGSRYLSEEMQKNYMDLVRQRIVEALQGNKKVDPVAIVAEALQKTFPSGALLPGQNFDHGGVVLGGKPHLIIDNKGRPVAKITEDRKPEMVRGMGGVEVIPLEPERMQRYLNSVRWGQLLGRMLPGAQTGQKYLFPSGTLPGPNLIPTSGGPATPLPIGTPYKPSSAPTSLSDLMAAVGSVPGGSYNERFARLLGGAISSNQALRPQAAALNMGLAPSQLPTAAAWRSLAPTMRSAYTALLQQMGIIQSPEDLAHYLSQYRPDALS